MKIYVAENFSLVLDARDDVLLDFIGQIWMVTMTVISRSDLQKRKGIVQIFMVVERQYWCLYFILGIGSSEA